MGRSHEYKSDGVSLHISDLKVPKKYITITTGPSQIDILDKTKLSIRFDSICTTTVNDVVYKLPLKQADPITHTFDAEKLVLKVNANKSDRIQLYLVWVSVQVLVFSKRIQFDGQIQPSPLPEAMKALHAKGIDLRTVTDPLIATQYVTMSDFVDYNLQIAVLRGIPVVSTKWLDLIENVPDDATPWLQNPPHELLLNGTHDDYIFPNSDRRLLLAGLHCLIYYEGAPLKHVRRLHSWLQCLGCANVITMGVNELTREAWSRLGSDSLFLFSCIEDSSSDTLRARANLPSDLWKAVVEVDILKLHISSCDSLFPPAVKEEPDSLRLTQRRKRRKVERVNDTDFFLFSQVTSHPEPESLEFSVGPEDDAPKHPEPESPANDVIQDVAQVKASQTTQEGTGISSSNKEKSVESVKVTISETTSFAKRQIEPAKINNQELEKRKEEISRETAQLEPLPKKQNVEEKWIVPQLSLAQAVLSTKRQAEDEAKKEFEFDDIGSQLEKLVVVEEIDLSRKNETVPLVTIALYNGRKNFKNFKKTGGPIHSFTRTFLELEDDNSNEIHFSNVPAAPPKQDISEKVRLDFAEEMDNVKGYQPSQLFVAEDEDEGDDGETTFSFLAGNRGSARVQADESDNDDGDFAFKFSRA